VIAKASVHKFNWSFIFLEYVFAFTHSVSVFSFAQSFTASAIKNAFGATVSLTFNLSLLLKAISMIS
jgi:hypothetical protein